MSIIAERVHRQSESASTSETIRPDEAKRLFDETAERYLNLSGAEFLKKWDEGHYRTSKVRTRAERVAMLIPMVRSTSARKKSC